MAKVDSIVYRYRGADYTLDIHFTKSDMFHIKGVPGEIIQFGGFVNRSETLRGLAETFRTAVRLAEDTTQCVRKVILVRFTIASQMISTPMENGRGHSIDMKHPLYKFCAGFNEQMNGYGFTIDYRTALEVANGTELLYFPPNAEDTTYRRGALTVSKNETPIPFSVNSIASLDMIKESLKNMVVNISRFFSDADKLGAALESGDLKALN